MDRTVGQVPDSMNNEIVSATSSCVAVGTLSEYDGKTRITLSDNLEESDNSKHKVFDDYLDTPSRKLSICSILNEPFIECNVKEMQTRIQIRINDKTEPNDIVVIVVPRQNENSKIDD